MNSFDELGISPELVEALAAEGIERPSAFQESAIPVLLRGNSLMAQAGPGAGTLVAYGLPLLQSVDPEALVRYQRAVTARSPQTRLGQKDLSLLRPAPGRTGPVLKKVRKRKAESCLLKTLSATQTLSVTILPTCSRKSKVNYPRIRKKCWLA